MVQKFFFLDLKEAGLVIAGLEIITAIFSLLSWIATYEYQSVLTLVAAIVLAALGVMLYHGTQEGKHLLLLPWLVVNGILIVLLGIIFVLAIIGLALSKSNLGHNVPPSLKHLPIISLLALVVEIVLLFGLFVYTWLAVRSLFIQIRRGRSYASEHPETLQALESGRSVK